MTVLNADSGCADHQYSLQALVMCAIYDQMSLWDGKAIEYDGKTHT